MNEDHLLSELTQEELIENNGGGTLLILLCGYVYQHRKEIWEEVVVAYVDGFREGYTSTVNK